MHGISGMYSPPPPIFIYKSIFFLVKKKIKSKGDFCNFKIKNKIDLLSKFMIFFIFYKFFNLYIVYFELLFRYLLLKLRLSPKCQLKRLKEI